MSRRSQLWARTRVARRPPPFIRSVVESAHIPGVARHVTSVRTIASAQSQPLDVPDAVRPRLLDGQGHETAFPEVVEIKVEDCLVDPANGAVYLPDEGSVLGESFGSYYRSRTWGAPLRRVPRRPTQLAGLAGRVVIPMPDTGYYHWLLEVMPSVVHSASVVDSPTLLVADTAKPYVMEAAQALGLPIHLVPSGEFVAAERVVFTSRPPVSGEAHPYNLRLLADLAATGERATPDQSPARVFVSRRLDRARWIQSQEQLESLATRLGFEVLVAQDLNWIDQVDMFSRATSLAGLHGAGLANMAFMRPGASLIELFPGDMRNWCYARAAHSLGMRYSAMSYSGAPGDGDELADLLRS